MSAWQHLVMFLLAVLRSFSKPLAVINGAKTYIGAGLIAVYGVARYATCPHVIGQVSGDIPALLRWITPEMLEMVYFLGASTVIVGFRHAIGKLIDALGSEIGKTVVTLLARFVEEYLRPMLEEFLKPKPPAPTPEPSPAPSPLPFPGPLFQDKLPTALLLVAMLLSGSAVYAAPPEILINGPTTAIAGELVTLDASATAGATAIAWLPWDESGRKMFDSCPGATAKIRIATYPGTWTYIVAATNGSEMAIKKHTITIKGDGPQPPGPAPTPVPPAPPVPPSPEPPGPVPPPLSEWSKQIVEFAKLVNTAGRKEQAEALARSCEGLASQIAAGALKGPRAILAAMTQANAAALGANLAQWKAFGDAFAAKLQAEYMAGRLNTDSLWADMLRQTAAGLRAVA